MRSSTNLRRELHRLWAEHLEHTSHDLMHTGCITSELSCFRHNTTPRIHRHTHQLSSDVAEEAAWNIWMG